MTSGTSCRRPADVFATTPLRVAGSPGANALRVGKSAGCNGDGSRCAQWRSRLDARGLTTRTRPLGSLSVMNDIARPLLLPTSATAAPTPAALPVQSPPRRVADLPGAEREPDIGLTWRRLDRLSAAARLGVILASPR